MKAALTRESVDWVMLLLIVTALSMATHYRNTLWNDEVALWRDCVKKSPLKERTHHNLGYGLLVAGRLDEAKIEFERALKLNPRHARSFYNLGLIGFALWKAKKRPFLSFWILWYFGNLVIESSIFPLEMVFEHRLYLPAVGPFVLFSLLLVRALEKVKTKYLRVETTGRVLSG